MKTQELAPMFSLETSTKGLLQAFEAACEAFQVPPHKSKPLFITAMKGNAQSWLYGLPNLASMSFHELKAKLLSDYTGEPVTHKRELEKLRQGNKTLSEHHKRFMYAVSMVKGQMERDSVIDCYIDSPPDEQVRNAVLSHQGTTECSLPQLMTTAANMTTNFKKNRNKRTNQDPNRHRYPDCGFWKNMGTKCTRAECVTNKREKGDHTNSSLNKNFNSGKKEDCNSWKT